MRAFDRELVAERKAEYPEGTRVRLVEYTLDPGLRIWPLQDGTQLYRVVQVRGSGAGDYDGLYCGRLVDCEARYPDARHSVNDNESVPPGTEGTVSHVDDFGTVKVDWDNGRSIGVTVEDSIEKCEAELRETFDASDIEADPKSAQRRGL